MTEEQMRQEFYSATPERIGKFGEAVWKTVFQSSGIAYIPLCNIEIGAAPMMGQEVLPDFQLRGLGFGAYLDSKCKRGPVLYRLQNQLRHGIDRRNYEHYCRISCMERKDAGLGIVELFSEAESIEWSGSLLVESFRNLSRPIEGSQSQSHMVYWPQKRFVNLHSFSALELRNISRGEKCCSFNDELTRIFKEPPKQCNDGEHDCEDVVGNDKRVRRTCRKCGRFIGYVEREPEMQGGLFA